MDRGTVALAFVPGATVLLGALGCGVRETPVPTRGSPWRICCGGGRAPVATLRRRRHPRRDSPRGPTARAALRRSGTTTQPNAPKPVASAKCARSLGTSPSPAIRLLAPLHSPPIARVRLGHACAARADRRRLAFTRTTAPRVARSARGRPAAASAWAPRSHRPAPTPDRTRSKRRRGAPRCRTSVRAGRAAQRTTNPSKARPVRLHAWHPTKCR